MLNGAGAIGAISAAFVLTGEIFDPDSKVMALQVAQGIVHFDISNVDSQKIRISIPYTIAYRVYRFNELISSFVWRWSGSSCPYRLLCCRLAIHFNDFGYTNSDRIFHSLYFG